MLIFLLFSQLASVVNRQKPKTTHELSVVETSREDFIENNVMWVDKVIRLLRYHLTSLTVHPLERLKSFNKS